MEGYFFLIKNRTSGCADKTLTFKMYYDAGETEPYSTDDLVTLADKYTELLNTYSKDRIYPVHFLDVNINPVISECDGGTIVE